MGERIHTRTAVAGFVVSAPRLEYVHDRARLSMQFGIEHTVPSQGGGPATVEPTFHDLVMWGHAAERAFAAGYQPGDHFLAIGRARERLRFVNHLLEPVVQFVARHIGPDGNVHTVAVDRHATESPWDTSASPTAQESASPEDRAHRLARLGAERAARLGVGNEAVALVLLDSPPSQIPF